jgi:hypothetical protein
MPPPEAMFDEANEAVRAGEIGKRAAVATLMFGFKMSREAAVDMLADEEEGSHPPEPPAPLGPNGLPVPGQPPPGVPKPPGADKPPPFGGKVGDESANDKAPPPEE